ncbi:MAG: tetratricopeptide repeat protein [Treponema sp.]|jgi:tetratricopeptide (TPR) repeat protein|nr:tetratricopeptide repeat protein [Treponema sp.]
MRINFAKHGVSFLIAAFFVFLALGSGTTETAVTETAVTVPAITETKTAQSYYDEGMEALYEQNWNWAIINFTRAINRDPNFELAYINRGAAYFNQGKFEEALADYNKVIELNPGLQEEIDQRITAVQQQKEQAEAQRNLIAQEKAQEKAQEQAREEAREKAQKEAWEKANGYDSAKFIIVPKGFSPSWYTKADLFDAAAAAEKLNRSAMIAPDGTVWPAPSRNFASEVVFVSQNGTDITFRTADNAISRSMKVDGRTGLTAGQRVRIYYTVYRIENWHVNAIERL